jgi:hypothetical protein
LAFKGLEYAVPVVAAGNDLVVTLSGPGEEEPVVMVTDAVPDLLVLSLLVAVTVAVLLVVTVGAW